MAYEPYIDFDEFAAWTQLAGSTKAAVVEEVIDATSRGIDEYCQRNFWQSDPESRTFEPCDPWRLDFGQFNDLLTIISLKTDATGDGTFETTWAASDYQLLPFNRPTGHPYTSIEAVAGRRFPIRSTSGSGRRDRVQVTGIWGWGGVPAGVKQACKIKAAHELTRMQSPGGFAGTGEFVIRINRNDDPDAVRHLDPYQHEQAHGV